MVYPARGDEMVNQEPDAVLEAEEEAEEKVGRSMRWTLALPVLAAAGGVALYTSGRRSLGAVAFASGAATALATAALWLVRGRHERDEAAHDELEELDAERSAIETGRI